MNTRHHDFYSGLKGEFKHEVRQFQKPYDNQQAEQNPKNTALCTIFTTYTSPSSLQVHESLANSVKIALISDSVIKGFLCPRLPP